MTDQPPTMFVGCDCTSETYLPRCPKHGGKAGRPASHVLRDRAMVDVPKLATLMPNGFWARRGYGRKRTLLKVEDDE